VRTLAVPLLLLLAACGGAAADAAPATAAPTTASAGAATAAAPACRSDADCVPAQCCHPTTCVLRADAPDCSAVACTRHCAPDTMDCGGRCLCRDGRCEAILAGHPPLRDVVPAR